MGRKIYGLAWRVQRFAGVFVVLQLRLDDLGPLPASRFPDLPDETKAWMRAEVDATGGRGGDSHDAHVERPRPPRRLER